MSLVYPDKKPPLKTQEIPWKYWYYHFRSMFFTEFGYQVAAFDDLELDFYYVQAFTPEETMNAIRKLSIVSTWRGYV